jgi:hypothetical protein
MEGLTPSGFGGFGCEKIPLSPPFSKGDNTSSTIGRLPLVKGDREVRGKTEKDGQPPWTGFFLYNSYLTIIRMPDNIWNIPIFN